MATKRATRKKDTFGGVVALVVGGLFATWVALMTLWVTYGAAGLIALLCVVGGLVLVVAGSCAVVVARRRAAEADAEADYRAWLAEFPAPLQHAMRRLSTDFEAAKLWASVGLGREPRWVGTGDNAVFDPGAWPKLVPRPHPDAPRPPKARPWRPAPALKLADRGAVTTRIGVRLRLRMLDGQDPDQYAKVRRALASALDIPGRPDRQPNIRIADGSGSIVVLDLKCVDPLAGMTVSPLLDDTTAARVEWVVKNAETPAQEAEWLTQVVQEMRLSVPVDSLSCTDDILIGISEYGEPIVINLAAGIHGAVQGASRSGKSITLNELLAYAALMRDVKVCIIDPNTALVAPWWRTAHKVCRSQNPADATALLEEVTAELKARESMFWAARTDRITSFSPEVPLYLVVIDEVAAHSDDKKFQAALKEASAQLAKYGGRLYLAGQKLGEKSLDTGTRANLYDRICHRVETDEDFRHLFPNATALTAAGLNAVDDAMPQGVAIVRMRTSKEPVRMRSVYLPTEACWVIADAIVAVRGEVRPEPTDTPLALTEGATVVGIPSHLSIIDAALDDDVVICALTDCDTPVESTGVGRPGKYCSPAHRQASWRLRKLAEEGRGDDIDAGEENAV